MRSSAARPSARSPRLFRSARGREWLAGAVWLAAVFVGIPSCEGRAEDEPVVVTVGTREIRRGELERAFWEQRRSDPSLRPDSAGLRQFLPGFLDDVIWQEVARREIPELEPVARERLDEFREQKLVAILREEAYLRDARPKEAEIRRAYETLGRKLHLRYMKLATREQAEQILDALRQGAVFAKVAEHESRDESSRGQGGDIGWLTYYDLDPGVRDRVFALKSGEVGGPFQQGGDWQLFQVAEEAPNPARGTLEAERPMLRQGLSMTGVMQGRRAFVDGLYRKYRLTLDPVEVAWMTAFLREKTASVARDIGNYSQEQVNDPEFRREHMGNPFPTNPILPADSSRVLATFDGEDRTTQKVPPILVLDQLMTDAPFSWPKFETTADVENLVRELVLERLEIGEAESRKIGERPEVLILVREREAQIRARYFYRTRLRPRAAPAPAEVRDYYDSHPEEFREAEQRRFQALNAASQEIAGKVRDLFREGLPPSRIRSALLVDDPSLNGTGDDGTPFLRDGQSPLLDPFLFGLPLNGVSDPIPVEGRFTVAKVIAIQPGKVTPFEQASKDLAVSLGTKRTDELLKTTIEQARPDFPVKINEEALRQVRLTPPPEE